MKDLIKIPVQLLNSNIDYPKYAYPGDAGFDLCSCTDVEILPQKRCMIKCGFAMSIPDGYAGLVIPRSGLALKHGITVLNSPGLIDSGYRGEICVVLYNSDNENKFKICFGDRIAQMVIISHSKVNFINCENLDKSDRSNKGFGSSGTN